MEGRGKRRALVLGALVGASLLCVVLVALPVDPTWEYTTVFLVWNLWLAWIPFVLALLLYDGYRRAWAGWLLVTLGVLWLLFLPNAPYIVTDLVHLQDPGAQVLWFDALMIGAFALVGLALGLGSLVLVHSVVADRLGPAAGWVVGIGALVLSSVGIYLGRVVEVNSWDAVVAPGKVLEPIVGQLRESPLHPHFIAVTLALTVFLVGSYVLVYRVAQPAVALEMRGGRRTRR
jgi:uncharacterized membrane protein